MSTKPVKRAKIAFSHKPSSTLRKPLSFPNKSLSFARTSLSQSRAAVKPLKGRNTRSDYDGCEASDSDSLVRIREDQAVAEHQKLTTDLALDKQGQISRIATSHRLASAIAAQVADELGDSESVAEEAADIARLSVASTIPASQVRIADIPAKRGEVSGGVEVDTIASHAIFTGASSDEGPMSIVESYDKMHEYVQMATQASDIVPVASNSGSRVFTVASQLVREYNENLGHEIPLPRTFMTTGNPLEDTFLQKLVTKAVDTSNAPVHLNPVVEAELRACLIPSRREHEEKMLRAARPNEPRCVAAGACRGNKIECRNGGATLMPFYSEDEWEKYQMDLRDGRPARLPDNPRRCLLCLRYEAAWFIVNLRAENVAFRATKKRKTLATQYFNKVNARGEYCLEDCMVPQEHVFEGFMYPLIAPNERKFERVVDQETGDIYFRQLLAYPGSTKPRRQGEMKHF